MQLDRVVIEKFKKIKKIDLDLENLNILVGTNGSGKSSVLQAIHFAICLMRQAKNSNTKRETLHPDQIDYLPTNEYAQLGHKKAWANKEDLQKSVLYFYFLNSIDDHHKAKIAIQQARNTGIAVNCTLPTNLRSMFRGKDNFLSAYIPGISGIPNEEQKYSERVVLKACSFGHANTYLRNALLLLKNKSSHGKEFEKLQEWISRLIDDKMKIDVSHDDKSDLTIDVKATFKKHEMPLELLGMGYLQIIQIFCYLLLFNPKILLIDEPDIHLHPDIQMRLPAILAKIANDRKLKIVMATHSPFIVRGTPVDANVYWMKDGEIKDSNASTIELALGWGVFGKEILLLSEDKNIFFLNKILDQWPGKLKNSTAVLPGKGYKYLPTPEQAKELKETLGNSFEIVIHRDRDAMNDNEVKSIKKRYFDKDIYLWITDHSDIESYFCLPEFLKKFLSHDDFNSIELNEIINKNNTINCDKFSSHRDNHNKEFYQGDGGSPKHEDVWNEFQSKKPFMAACGKNIFKILREKLKHRFNDKEILAYQLDGNIANSLKNLLEDILGKSKKSPS